MTGSRSQTATPAGVSRSRFSTLHAAELFIVAIANGIAETKITADWLRGDLALDYFLLSHTAVVGFLALWLRTLALRRAGLRHAAMITLMTFVLGPYGAWGSLLSLCLHGLLHGKPRSIEDWYKAIMPEAPPSMPERIYHAVKSGAVTVANDQDVASFIDVLMLGTTAQKQALIAMIIEHFCPTFAPILLKALQHDDPAVRVMAATAMSQITAKIDKQTKELKAQTLQEPDNPARFRDLGLHLKRWADTGLSDPEQTRQLRQSALDALFRSLELDGRNEETIVAIGDLLIAQREYADAVYWLDRYPVVRDSNPDAFLSYLQALYNLGHLDTLRERVASSDAAPAFAKLQPDSRSMLALWREPGKSAAAVQ